MLINILAAVNTPDKNVSILPTQRPNNLFQQKQIKSPFQQTDALVLLHYFMVQLVLVDCEKCARCKRATHPCRDGPGNELTTLGHVTYCSWLESPRATGSHRSC